MTFMHQELSFIPEEQPPLEVWMEPGERIREIYADEWKRLRGFATLITGDISSGEDLAQSVFVEALQHERTQPGYLRNPVWPWLRMVAVRIATRQRARLRMQLDRLRLLAADSVEPTWHTETIDIVRALKRLPPRMRMCVVLAYLEDQSTASVAEALGCTPKTVENQLREGRRRLRSLIDAS
jgi:RNA polymerase sigma factor (sigma-70 family)